MFGYNNLMANKFLYETRRVILVLLGAVLLAVNINSFVHAGRLLPGGFMGLTLLIQEICSRFGGFEAPFSLFYFILNLVPAVFCFKFIGKKFTIYSVLFIIVSGLLADFMPSMFYSFLQTQNSLLSAVFGGLLNAVAISLSLHADATSGGTDFIAIVISEKYRKDAWNYILGINIVILAVAGIFFGEGALDRVLYSIIFQFVTTMALGVLYRNYQQRTLLIVTDKPEEIYKAISNLANHGATLIDCFGSYNKNDKTLLYSVVTASQVKKLIPEIRKIDPEAFINVLKTQQLNGRFYQRPKD